MLTLTLSHLCGPFSTPLWADGPADNMADKVRPIPPPGIQVPAEVKSQLLSTAEELDQRLHAVTKVPELDRVQVALFSRAVRMTIEDGMFYSEKEFDQAARLLALGNQRLSALVDGGSGLTLLLPSVVKADQPILAVGGYRSRIDGSIQPFGLVLPPSLLTSPNIPRRLDVWLHGRGEKVSEVAFLHQRLNNVGEVAPANTIVLHPYGRYCNAFKFAGEIDVLEAIEAVKRIFAIDQDRITIRGFSMGGAGCWQMAVHYPGMWMAATPGAGFSETRQFLKVFQKEDFQPTPTQERLLHWYDCPDWAGNLRLLPTVAYSGELDNQKQAADVMVAAMQARGLQLPHIIGPQTAHKLHPDSKIEIENFLSAVAQKGRSSMPAEIDFTTYSLRYAQDRWVTITGLGEHWQAARVQAKIATPSSVNITTENIASLSLELPLDQQLLDASQPIELIIDGQSMAWPVGSAGQPLAVDLIKRDGRWQVGEPVQTGGLNPGASQEPGLRKRPGLQGPIDDAFMDAFVFVGPDSQAATPGPVDGWVSDEFARAKAQWRQHFRGDIVERSAAQVDDAILAENNLVLFGTPETNSLIARVVQQIPLTWKRGQPLAIGQHQSASDQHVAVMIYPNPLNPSRYVVLNSGFTYREFAYLNNARQIAMLPDWAIVDVTSGRNYQNPGKVVEAGFFDEAWNVK